MLTTHKKNSIVDGIVGNSGTAYLGLSSTTPNADGTGVTEPSGNGYARVLIGQSDQSLTKKFAPAENGEATNKDIIYFPESTGSWGAALTHFVLFNSETSTQPSAVQGFELLKNEGVASPITVSAANTVVMFRIGDLTVKCEDAE